MNQGINYDLAAVMPAAIESGLFVSLCSILVPDGEFGDSGAPSGNYVVLMVGSPAVSLEDIPCTAPPLMTGGKVTPTEVKELKEILSDVPLHVLLSGYCPEIASTYRAVVDGINYEIMGVEHDSQSLMTRLAVRELTI